MDEGKLLPCEKLLHDWQTECSEWHGRATLEVVREYAEWREARPTLGTDEVVERVAMILNSHFGVGNEEHWPVYVEAARAAIAAMPTIDQDGGWQPIESAPKGDDPKELNGPPIIIARTGEWAYEGFWYSSDQAWYFANMDSEYGSPEYPTHWRPLPNPPTQPGASQ